MSECGTDESKTIWREKPDDYYLPSIISWPDGRIGINVGGHVVVKNIRDWHQLGKPKRCTCHRCMGIPDPYTEE